MLTLDSLAYRSKISRFDPRAKLCFALIPLIIVLVLGKIIVSLLCMFIMAVTTLRFSRLGLKKYIGLMSVPLGFLIVGTMTVMIGRHSLDASLLISVKIKNYAYGISGEALDFGLVLILRALACVSCMYFISFNTPMTQLFMVLRELRVPSLIVSLMELIYRYIFVVLEESDRIFVAQSSRGIGHSFSARLRAFGELVASLLQRSLNRSNRIVSALEARGYDGNFYVLPEVYKSGKKLYVMTLLISIFLIVIGFWR